MIGNFAGWVRALGLATGLVLAGAPALQAQEPAAEARLVAWEAPSGGHEVPVGASLELVVRVERGGQGAVGEPIAWSLEDPSAGELAEPDAKTRPAAGEQPSGLARVRFTPARAAASANLRAIADSRSSNFAPVLMECSK